MMNRKGQTLRPFDYTQGRTLSVVERVRHGAGQSTVEYILLVAAVIAVIIVLTGPGGAFRTKLQSSIDKTTDGMGSMADRLMGATNPN